MLAQLFDGALHGRWFFVSDAGLEGEIPLAAQNQAWLLPAALPVPHGLAGKPALMTSITGRSRFVARVSCVMRCQWSHLFKGCGLSVGGVKCGRGTWCTV